MYKSFRRSLRLRFELHAGLVAVGELDAAGLKRVPNKRFLVPRFFFSQDLHAPDL